MALEKLTIKPLDPSKIGKIKVLFNPTSYTIRKSVTWARPGSTASITAQAKKTQHKFNAPALEFGGGGSRELNLDLFFDVTESNAEDVRSKTNKIVLLTRIERTEPKRNRPPVCEVTWGNAPPDSDFPFVGVVSNLTQNFTLFKGDGTPVRANLNVTFLEFQNHDKDLRKTDPEVTTHIVKRGDTVSFLAAHFYGESSLWRVIAEENNLDNPRELKIGSVLTIPKVS